MWKRLLVSDYMVDNFKFSSGSTGDDSSRKDGDWLR